MSISQPFPHGAETEREAGVCFHVARKLVKMTWAVLHSGMLNKPVCKLTSTINTL